MIDTLRDLLRQLITGTEYEGNVFIAGGCVRDCLMGRDPKDLDLVVNLPDGGIKFAQFVTDKLGIAKEGSNPVTFPRFGTAQVHFQGVIHNGVDLSGMAIETVMPRVETYAPGNRKPEVALGTLRDDVKRRDLTANSLLQDLTTEEILDLTGLGRQDIKDGIIRTPLDPQIIFTEDPLRMLRAIRFAVQLGWTFAPGVLEAIAQNAASLDNISRERVRDELSKILTSPDPRRGMDLLRSTGLIVYVHNRLAAALAGMDGMVQNRYHHLDVLQHVMEVLANSSPTLESRLAALLHDIAKPQCRTPHKTNKGEFSFLGHEDDGEQMTRDILGNLKFPQETINVVASAVKHHMFKDPKDVSDKAIRKWVRSVTEAAPDSNPDVTLATAFDLLRADSMGHSPHHRNGDDPGDVEYLKKRITEVADHKVVVRQRIVNGHDLMETFKLSPGPILRQILDYAQELVDENPSAIKSDLITAIAKQFSMPLL